MVNKRSVCLSDHPGFQPKWLAPSSHSFQGYATKPCPIETTDTIHSKKKNITTTTTTCSPSSPRKKSISLFTSQVHLPMSRSALSQSSKSVSVSTTLYTQHLCITAQQIFRVQEWLKGLRKFELPSFKLVLAGYSLSGKRLYLLLNPQRLRQWA